MGEDCDISIQGIIELPDADCPENTECEIPVKVTLHNNDGDELFGSTTNGFVVKSTNCSEQSCLSDEDLEVTFTETCKGCLSVHLEGTLAGGSVDETLIYGAVLGIEELCEDTDLVGDIIHVNLERVDAPVEYTVTTTTTLNTSSLTTGDESTLVENMNIYYSTLLAEFPVESIDTTTETGSVKLVTKIVFKSDATSEKLEEAKLVIDQVDKPSMIDNVLTPSLPESVVSALGETLEPPKISNPEFKITVKARPVGHVYQVCSISDRDGPKDVDGEYHYFIYASGFGTGGLLDVEGTPIGVNDSHKFISLLLDEESELELCLSYMKTARNYIYQVDGEVRTSYVHYEDLIDQRASFGESPCCEVVEPGHISAKQALGGLSTGVESTLTTTITLDVALDSITSDEQSALVNSTRIYFLSLLESSLGGIKEITTTIEEGSVKIITNVVLKGEATTNTINDVSFMVRNRVTKASVVSYVLTPSLSSERVIELTATLLDPEISRIKRTISIPAIDQATLESYDFDATKFSSQYNIIRKTSHFTHSGVPKGVGLRLKNGPYAKTVTKYYNERLDKVSPRSWYVAVQDGKESEIPDVIMDELYNAMGLWDDILFADDWTSKFDNQMTIWLVWSGDPWPEDATTLAGAYMYSASDDAKVSEMWIILHPRNLGRWARQLEANPQVAGGMNSLTQTLMHEMGHSFGMMGVGPAMDDGSPTFPEDIQQYYNGTTGEKIANWVELDREKERDLSDKEYEDWMTGVNPVWKGTNTVREYNALMGLDVDAVPITSKFGKGSSGSHISEAEGGRMFQYNGEEIFLPGVSIALMSQWATHPVVLDRLTLAVMEDYGYDVDYSLAHPEGMTYFELLGVGDQPMVLKYEHTNSVSIGLRTTKTGLGRIDWGDGKTEYIWRRTKPKKPWGTYDDIIWTHDYEEWGDYTVSVYGQVEKLGLEPTRQVTTVETYQMFEYSTKVSECQVSNRRLVGCESWGNLPLLDLDFAFSGSKLKTLPASQPPGLRSMDFTFSEMSAAATLDWGILSNWLSPGNTVYYLRNCFHKNLSVKNIDLSNWDTSRMSTGEGMFDGCTNLVSIGDISSWNISYTRGTGVFDMFRGCENLDYDKFPDLSGWCVKRYGSGPPNSYPAHLGWSPTHESKMWTLSKTQADCEKKWRDRGLVPVDCQLTAYPNWSDVPCMQGDSVSTCGSGIKTRTRTVQTIANYGGEACPEALDWRGEPTNNYIETRSCGVPCPKDCVPTGWSSWSDCLPGCNGSQIRRRSVKEPAQHGGEECGALVETRECNRGPTYSEWGNWGPCSEPCGGGIQTQTRTKLSDGDVGNTCDIQLTRTRECNIEACPPVDCKVSNWSDWGDCVDSQAQSVTCGGGIQTRERTIIAEAQHGGLCDFALSETRECNTNPCPVDCVMEDWSDGWGKCVCITTKSPITPQSNVYGPLPGPVQPQQWSSTITSQQTRIRKVLVEPQHGGQACPSHPDYPDQVYTWETRKDCSCDCETTEWSPWSMCSTGYGPWTKSRTREVVSEKYQGTFGTAEECDTEPGVVWHYLPGSYGSRRRVKLESGVTFQDSSNTGNRHIQHQYCPYPGDWDGVVNHLKYPPVDCQVSEWGDWSECPNVCSGTHSRTRTILTHRQGEGLDCPNLVESKPCQEPSCTECADSYLVFGDHTCGVSAPLTTGAGVELPRFVGRWHSTGEIINGRPVYHTYWDGGSENNPSQTPSGIWRLVWSPGVSEDHEKDSWKVQVWNQGQEYIHDSEPVGAWVAGMRNVLGMGAGIGHSTGAYEHTNSEYDTCNYPGNFAECPSSLCFHDNLTCGPRTNWAGTASDWTDEQVSTVLDERPECYGCVPIPTVYKPVVRMTDAPIRDDGMDINGLYYSNRMYNGFPVYYNSFNKEKLSVMIWRSRDLSYPKDNLDPYWNIDYRVMGDDLSWGQYNYVSYSYEAAFTPDLVTNWKSWDDKTPPNVVEHDVPPAIEFDIESIDSRSRINNMEDYYIFLEMSEDVSGEITKDDRVYIKGGNFTYETCRLFTEVYIPTKYEETYQVAAVEKTGVMLFQSRVPLNNWPNSSAPHQCGGHYLGGGKLVVVRE